MKDTLNESLSALLDGEASELELRRILNSRDETVRSRWAELTRGQQLRKDGNQPFANFDISARVMAEIAQQPGQSASSGHWRQALGGIAVAASVAAVVVFGAMGSGLIGGGDAVVASAESPSAGRVYPATAASANSGGIPVSAQLQVMPPSQLNAEEEARQRFEMYLRRHADRAAENSGQGVMSYTRAAGAESR